MSVLRLAVNRELRNVAESHPPEAQLPRTSTEGIQEDHLDPHRSSSQNTRIETKTLPPPAEWTTLERVSYGLHGIVWWARRVRGDASRRADAENVANFLVEKSLWLNRAAKSGVSDRALKRMDIERKFRWMSEVQIVNLAATISAFAARRDRSSKEEITALVYKSLFGNSEKSI